MGPPKACPPFVSHYAEPIAGKHVRIQRLSRRSHEAVPSQCRPELRC